MKYLYLLASQVAEGRAIDDRRKFFEHQAPTVNPQQGKREFRPVNIAVGETRRSLSRMLGLFSHIYKCNTRITAWMHYFSLCIFNGIVTDVKFSTE
jgi:hypothetical protein